MSWKHLKLVYWNINMMSSNLIYPNQNIICLKLPVNWSFQGNLPHVGTSFYPSTTSYSLKTRNVLSTSVFKTANPPWRCCMFSKHDYNMHVTADKREVSSLSQCIPIDKGYHQKVLSRIKTSLLIKYTHTEE